MLYLVPPLIMIIEFPIAVGSESIRVWHAHMWVSQFSLVKGAIVEIKFHGSSTEKRAVLVDAAPVVGIHAGLPRRENSRPCSSGHYIVVTFHCSLETDCIRREVRNDHLDEVKHIDNGMVRAFAPVCLDISGVFPAQERRALHIDMR